MDAAAAVVVARLDRLAVGVESLVARQQAGVDVEHPVLPSGDEIAAQDAHVAGKRDTVCACGAKLVVDQRVKAVAVHPLERKAPGRDALCRGECETGRGGSVACDKDVISRAASGMSGLEQEGQVGGMGWGAGRSRG